MIRFKAKAAPDEPVKSAAPDGTAPAPKRQSVKKPNTEVKAAKAKEETEDDKLI